MRGNRILWVGEGRRETTLSSGSESWASRIWNEYISGVRELSGIGRVFWTLFYFPVLTPAVFLITVLLGILHLAWKIFCLILVFAIAGAILYAFFRLVLFILQFIK